MSELLRVFAAWPSILLGCSAGGSSMSCTWIKRFKFMRHLECSLLACRPRSRRSPSIVRLLDVQLVRHRNVIKHNLLVAANVSTTAISSSSNSLTSCIVKFLLYLSFCKLDSLTLLTTIVIKVFWVEVSGSFVTVFVPLEPLLMLLLFLIAATLSWCKATKGFHVTCRLTYHA